jgi:hypothetical protein
MYPVPKVPSDKNDPMIHPEGHVPKGHVPSEWQHP